MKIENFRLSSHMNLGKEGIRVDAGKINDPGNIVHEKTIARQVHTKKTKGGGWGKGVVTWWIEDGTSKPPDFPTLAALMEHYKLSPLEKPTDEEG